MKKPAISFEKLEDTALSKISAADFLETLVETNKLAALINFPEKKKYELEVEPGVIGGITVGRLVEILERFKGEKKKYELELEPGIRDRIYPERLNTLVVDRLDDMNGRLAKLERKLGG